MAISWKQRKLVRPRLLYRRILPSTLLPLHRGWDSFTTALTPPQRCVCVDLVFICQTRPDLHSIDTSEGQSGSKPRFQSGLAWWNSLHQFYVRLLPQGKSLHVARPGGSPLSMGLNDLQEEGGPDVPGSKVEKLPAFRSSL